MKHHQTTLAVSPVRTDIERDMEVTTERLRYIDENLVAFVLSKEIKEDRHREIITRLERSRLSQRQKIRRQQQLLLQVVVESASEIRSEEDGKQYLVPDSGLLQKIFYELNLPVPARADWVEARLQKYDNKKRRARERQGG